MSRHNAAEHPRLSALQRPNEHALRAQAFKGLRSLILSTAFNATTAKGGNPLWPGIGYEGPDPERAQKPTQARLQAEAVLQRAMLHVGNAPCKNPEDFLDFIRSGFGKSFCTEASNPNFTCRSKSCALAARACLQQQAMLLVAIAPCRSLTGTWYGPS